MQRLALALAIVAISAPAYVALRLLIWLMCLWGCPRYGLPVPEFTL